MFPSGLTAQEGTIQKGDEVLSINGQTLRGAAHADATAALRQARTLKLVVVVVCKKAEEGGGAGVSSSCVYAASRCPAQGDEATLCVTVEAQGELVSVELEKGAGGVGFSLEGGKGSINGDRPLVINRIFKGERQQINGSSWSDAARLTR